ncbi:sterol 3-beta-glucosyltransferase UGT80B1-like [Durio zibethinus]|uniref:Sterol 3-beta-glucosyltransferase UGT80B1-like n=1 Tax=Durio zibethinus TaxID=66656 RepID=A0A6P6B893_DURZI|nr:sterol 3-beta-glucosyltransferase UGT80B1-like [Durio zibethinus]
MDTMGSNGVNNPLIDLQEENVGDGRSKGVLEDCEQTDDVDESVTVEYRYSDEQSFSSSYVEEENQKSSSERKSSVLEISQTKELSVTSSPRRGLDHCISEPVGAHGNLLIDDSEIPFSRSMMEKKAARHDLKLDRLSEREKVIERLTRWKKLIVDLVKIQNDGTVEVDLAKSSPVASELLELSSIEGAPFDVDDTSFHETNKSIPRLKIAILVVGTRGDVQTFLAMAKRLQEFGHHVRLATHANFSSFVKLAGIDFYPLGGDPRVLAGCKRTLTLKLLQFIIFMLVPILAIDFKNKSHLMVIKLIWHLPKCTASCFACLETIRGREGEEMRKRKK